MHQTTLFEETVDKKIARMERQLGNMQKELWFLKEVHIMCKSTRERREKTVSSKNKRLSIIEERNFSELGLNAVYEGRSKQFANFGERPS